MEVENRETVDQNDQPMSAPEVAPEMPATDNSPKQSFNWTIGIVILVVLIIILLII